jgi:hypothetical protein
VRSAAGVVNLPVAPAADSRAEPLMASPQGTTYSPERAAFVPNPSPAGAGRILVLSAANSTLSVSPVSAAGEGPAAGGPSAGPDLHVTRVAGLRSAAFGGSGTPALPGGYAERAARVTVHNAGTATAAGTVRVRLVASVAHVPADLPDAVLTEALVPLRLAPGRSRTVRLPAFVLGAQLPDAHYRIVAQVDADNAVDELDEGNNLADVVLIVKYTEGQPMPTG